MIKDWFIDYCMKFYAPGPDALNPIEGLTRKEVAKALSKHIASGADFAADSFDREAVRNIILKQRELGAR